MEVFAGMKYANLDVREFVYVCVCMSGCVHFVTEMCCQNITKTRLPVNRSCSIAIATSSPVYGAGSDSFCFRSVLPAKSQEARLSGAQAQVPPTDPHMQICTTRMYNQLTFVDIMLGIACIQMPSRFDSAAESKH